MKSSLQFQSDFAPEVFINCITCVKDANSKACAGQVYILEETCHKLSHFAGEKAFSVLSAFVADAL
jgi:hypothetical protein